MNAARVCVGAIVLVLVGYVSTGMVLADKGQSAGQDAETSLLAKPGSSDKAFASKAVVGVDVLFQLAGRWKVDEDYPKSDDFPNGGEGKGTAGYKKSLDNTCLIGDYKTRCKALNFDVKVHAVYTYDEEQDAYLMWWFDNYGARSEFQGEYDDSKRVLTFRREVEGEDGEVINHVHTYKFLGDGSVTLTMKAGSGDKTRRYETLLTSVFSKKGSREEDEEDQPVRKRAANKVRL